MSVLVPSTVASLLPPRTPDSHKGDYGHAFLLAGSKGMAGASVLASRACLRSGVGLLTVSAPECNRLIVQTAVPEAMTLINGTDFLDDVPTIPARCNAVAVGPGLGRHPLTAEALLSLFEDQPSLAPVIDADAITLLAPYPEVFQQLSTDTIVTPHPGEFASLLLPFGMKYDPSSREEQAQYIARQLGICVVLKGHGTIVASPSGQTALNITGNAGMATAGSGDVLTGIILALRAQGLKAYDAACLGVCVHGLAGDKAAEAVGQIALTASDIVASLPEAWKTITASQKTCG